LIPKVIPLLLPGLEELLSSRTSPNEQDPSLELERATAEFLERGFPLIVGEMPEDLIILDTRGGENEVPPISEDLESRGEVPVDPRIRVDVDRVFEGGPLEKANLCPS
jgi:hypothetical protein